MKLGRQCKDHNRRATLRIYAHHITTYVQVWHISCPLGQVFDSREAACTELEEERVALDTGKDIVTIIRGYTYLINVVFSPIHYIFPTLSHLHPDPPAQAGGEPAQPGRQ